MGSWEGGPRGGTMGGAGASDRTHTVATVVVSPKPPAPVSVPGTVTNGEEMATASPAVVPVTPLRTPKSTALQRQGRRSALLRVVLTAGAVVAGLGSATQAGVNAALADDLGSAIYASTISFYGGTVLLFLAFVVLRLRAREVPVPVLSATARPKPWHFVGGMLGVGFVVSVTFLVPRAGFGVVFVCLRTGQLGMSVALDHLVHHRRAGRYVAAGVACMLAGSVLFALDSLREGGSDGAGATIAWALLSIFAGALLPAQAAVNRKLSVHLRGTQQALGGAVCSFTVGSLTLTLVSMVSFFIRPDDWHSLGSNFEDVQGWEALGGALGMWLVLSGITFPAVIGFALYSNGIVVGSLGGAVVYDAVAFLRDEKSSPSAAALVGLALVVAALWCLWVSTSRQLKRQAARMMATATATATTVGTGAAGIGAVAAAASAAAAGAFQRQGQAAIAARQRSRVASPKVGPARSLPAASAACACSKSEPQAV